MGMACVLCPCCCYGKVPGTWCFPNEVNNRLENFLFPFPTLASILFFNCCFSGEVCRRSEIGI